MCDLIVVNKSDGAMIPAAIRTQSEYLSALKYSRHRSAHWGVPVMRVSSLRGEGMGEVWETCEGFREKMLLTEQLVSRRR